MNQNQSTSTAAISIAGAYVGILCWMLGLHGVDIPAQVEGYMVTLAGAGLAIYCHMNPRISDGRVVPPVTIKVPTTTEEKTDDQA